MAESVYSKNYELIKGYYDSEDSGKWNIDRVFNCVGKSTGITESEYKEITGFEYPNKEK